MHKLLNANLFLVKEHVGLFKAANNFDIYDPQTGQIVMECREDRLGTLTKLLRFSKYKKMTPFDVQVRTPEGQQIVRVTRGVCILRSTVSVLDENNELIGRFRQKLLTIGGAFNVLDANDNPVCHLKGKWTGWDFRFLRDDVELAHVSKKWAGLGKEFFTSADNYILEISEAVPPDSRIRQLILAAVMCIDMVLKE
jgi:uncharacterized protein YxjI